MEVILIIIAIIIGVIIYNFFGGVGLLIVGGIVVIGGIVISNGIGSNDSSSGSSSTSSSGSSITDRMNAHRESRKNDPHTCSNCTKYSSVKGECRLNGSPKSEMDSCSSWC